jgi:YHS domain-containing protein
MNTPTLYIALALLGLGLSSCSGSNSSAKPYPLSTCLVSGNELGSMGTPITQIYNGQQIKFCCKPCVKKFNDNPQKYLSQLER